MFMLKYLWVPRIQEYMHYHYQHFSTSLYIPSQFLYQFEFQIQDTSHHINASHLVKNIQSINVSLHTGIQ